MRYIDSDKRKFDEIMSLFDSALIEMTKFVKLSEKFLKKELKTSKSKERKRSKKLPKNLSKEQREEYLGFLEDDPYELSEVYPRIQRYSLYISLMGIIEQHFQNICKSIQEITKNSLSVTNLNGRGIVRSLDYLIKVFGFRISQRDKKELRLLQKIRNVIVHANGKAIGKDLTSIKEYAKLSQHIDVDERNRIVLTGQFLDDILSIATQLFGNVSGQIDRMIRKA